MKKEQIDIDNLIAVGAEFISDSKPKTFVGKVLRVIKKLAKLKILLGIKIK